MTERAAHLVDVHAGRLLDAQTLVVSGDRIVAVGKDLPPAMAHHRSLGFVASTGGEGYLAALDRVIRDVDGVQRFHHAVIDRLAREGTVHAIPFADGLWTEIDRPEDITRWTDEGDGGPFATGRASALLAARQRLASASPSFFWARRC